MGSVSNGGFVKNILFCGITVATILAALVLFPKLRPTVTAGNAVNADTLRQLEAEFMKAAAEKGSQGYMSYYADDAVEVPNGAAIIQGKANIAKGMGFLDQTDNRLIWTPVGADVSASGDLGYTYGNYEFHSKDKEGKPIIEHGKYTSIWKKQKDGSWKVVLDMGNASPEAK
jgi:ketosteroid isomerase-like protein